jgi:XTP/dITP diphosphohydrolase
VAGSVPREANGSANEIFAAKTIRLLCGFFFQGSREANLPSECPNEIRSNELHYLHRMKELVFATHNEHKVVEIQDVLGEEFQISSLSQLGFSEAIPEDRDTLEGNAMQKAKYVYERLLIDCFADDTGLEVAALDGAPGVFSARYAEISNEVQKGDTIPDANMRKLLKRLEGISEREASFKTVIALIINGKQYTFEGVVEGAILSRKKGTGGFGYDPVFLPDGYGKTFAEMSLQEKNNISHRSRAVLKLADFLKNYTEE